jgi:hypothetical protein
MEEIQFPIVHGNPLLWNRLRIYPHLINSKASLMSSFTSRLSIFLLCNLFAKFWCRWSYHDFFYESTLSIGTSSSMKGPSRRASILSMLLEMECIRLIRLKLAISSTHSFLRVKWNVWKGEPIKVCNMKVLKEADESHSIYWLFL